MRFEEQLELLLEKVEDGGRQGNTKIAKQLSKSQC
jgi:hypothetical protein